MRLAGLFCVGLTAGVLVSPAAGQTSPAASPAKPSPLAVAPIAAREAYEQFAAPPNLALGAVAGTSIDSAKGFVLQPLLQASTDQKSASAVLGWKNGQGQFSLGFKAPLDTKSSEAVPLTLDGLSVGSTVEFQFNRLMWSGPNLEE